MPHIQQVARQLQAVIRKAKGLIQIPQARHQHAAVFEHQQRQQGKGIVEQTVGCRQPSCSQPHQPQSQSWKPKRCGGAPVPAKCAEKGAYGGVKAQISALQQHGVQSGRGGAHGHHRKAAYQPAQVAYHQKSHLSHPGHQGGAVRDQIGKLVPEPQRFFHSDLPSWQKYQKYKALRAFLQSV